MAYGNAQRLGQTIDPSLMRADYSGYANAGAILGNTLANVGEKIGDALKMRAESQKEIDSGVKMATAIKTAIPQMSGMADQVLDELTNPELSTNQKLASLRGIKEAMQISLLGKQESRADAMLKLQQDELRAKTQGGSMWSITPQRADAYRKAGYKLEIIGENPDGTLIVKTAQGQGVGSGGVIPIQTENGIIFQQQPPPSYAPTPSSFNNNNYPDGVDIGNAMPVENGGTWGVTQAGEVGDLPSDNVKAINIRAGNQSEMPLNPVDTESFDNPLIGVNTNVADNIQSAQNLPTTPVPTGDVWRKDRDGLVAGQIPGSKQDLEAQRIRAELEKTKLETQKIQGEQGKQTTQAQKSKDNFSSVMGEASNAYANLYKKGGAVVGGEFSLGQVLASTQAGQKFGEITGSEAQQFRNYLGSLAPKILLGIMASTGLSATQLNSNAELQLQLQSLGDPSKPIQSNLAALHTLDKMYGDGTAVPKMLKNNPELNSLMEKSGFDYGVEESKKSDVLKMFELDPRLR
jgi:hypothetical protein